MENHIREGFFSGGGGRSGVKVPTRIIKNLRRINKRLHIGRQEDAHEFLRMLVDHMQGSEYNHPLKLSQPLKLKSLIGRVFGGLMKSVVKCGSCGHRSIINEVFYDVSLDITKGGSL